MNQSKPMTYADFLGVVLIVAQAFYDHSSEGSRTDAISKQVGSDVKRKLEELRGGPATRS